jgi:hypothetical protein
MVNLVCTVEICKVNTQIGRASGLYAERWFVPTLCPEGDADAIEFKTMITWVAVHSSTPLKEADAVAQLQHTGSLRVMNAYWPRCNPLRAFVDLLSSTAEFAAAWQRLFREVLLVTAGSAKESAPAPIFGGTIQ